MPEPKFSSAYTLTTSRLAGEERYSTRLLTSFCMRSRMFETLSDERSSFTFAWTFVTSSSMVFMTSRVPFMLCVQEPSAEVNCCSVSA